jgi:uncharacterized protein YeaO (DUF488 family)
MSKGYDIDLTDEVTGERFKVKQTTGCRCLSCPELTLYWYYDEKQKWEEYYTEYGYELKDRAPKALIIHLMAKKIQELEQKLQELTKTQES